MPAPNNPSPLSRKLTLRIDSRIAEPDETRATRSGPAPIYTPISASGDGEALQIKATRFDHIPPQVSTQYENPDTAYAMEQPLVVLDVSDRPDLQNLAALYHEDERQNGPSSLGYRFDIQFDLSLASHRMVLTDALNSGIIYIAFEPSSSPLSIRCYLPIRTMVVEKFNLAMAKSKYDGGQ